MPRDGICRVTVSTNGNIRAAIAWRPRLVGICAVGLMVLGAWYEPLDLLRRVRAFLRRRPTIMSRYLFIAVAVSVTLFTGCDQRFIDAIGEAKTIDAHVVMDGPEALEWLKVNKNESALASNRFLETPNSVKFVKALYAAGAVKVIVPKDTIRDDADTVSFEGGPYADALVVTIPTEPSKRQAVVDLCRAELKREGFDSEEVETAPQIYLWWD
jgi:hypothetical protein